MPIVELEEGKNYSYCTCGHSETKPFCDGAHKEKGGGSPLRFKGEKTGGVALCGCGKSQNKPYCDGSHNS
ncbi:CDGSH iron-sulfur domain-containing protein [Wenyingzhuangia sp. 2_MG-2023]|uniref:CDGSH iron-sulfur domain-containing protein n=1 Tax=Wenyingzhuangia sp. 2_MG-2023 TaxID=3062639 RepID=UPI0026E3E6FE|nr:CDGSH iron-sulfur domain-containing protein [Wenyingzhuangia sp. 2_MG-2023]MDO6736844.1 CDGSH iron-sulfur domain-containing protein [Wenyingzhuangia sp. 2_MG-2023]